MFENTQCINFICNTNHLNIFQLNEKDNLTSNSYIVLNLRLPDKYWIYAKKKLIRARTLLETVQEEIENVLLLRKYDA